jgi:two-component system KDP operon response regulator KdpE
VTDELKVLVVEDEDSMRRFLRPVLAAQGYRVIEATTGVEALRLTKSHDPDVVMLDLGLSEAEGIEVTRHLRAWFQGTILILSARGNEMDKVQALDAGADDYLTKPFGVHELLARLRVARRHAEARARGSSDRVLRIGPLRIDLDKRLVMLDEREVRLTPIEYRLLLFLAHNAGKTVTHKQMLHQVWGPSRAGQTQYLHVYVGQLRAKLEADPTRPRLLITEPSVGYRLSVD